ncbi:hypothetical protein GCM10020369_34920 [Cryptosporangium minutisporangium]|uniref:Membrane dipeptidase (Peptidase family M19) n=1 Tax=Cryptosporangium minutisporangium TaxID=113569 RepID=A0ABP6SYF6_9ACTN
MRSRRRASMIATVAAVICALLAGGGGATATERPWYEPVSRPSPDAEIGVTGAPFKGTDARGRVRGFVDTHNHVMTNEAFGGKVICGRPFSASGIADALKDCPEHYPDGGGALLENLTVDSDGRHDPVGWPTFRDWPSHTTLTHQQNYYAWIERAWRAGQRVMVTNLTSNAVLCTIHVRDRGCDEMESIRLQARNTRELQTYIDTMYGGPGKGWFRIVSSPADARRVIKAGKLAVVLGVETSEPFGCKQTFDFARCTTADIDRGLDEFKALGVQSMFLCHKFDNALCGVRFDQGATGTILNVGQFVSTGTWWQTEACKGPQKDNPIGSVPVPAIENWLPPGTTVPKYPSGAQCNVRGLTELGEYALRGMMKRGMMVELDHMSVKAAGSALDLLEARRYGGVISSHSWMDQAWIQRLYALGGFIGSYGMDSESFVRDAGATAALRRQYGVGLGFGSDFNGLGSHPTPRGADAPDKVTYPFRTFSGGPLVDRQVTGQRTWDVNTDGGAHYGLVPDWIEDVHRLGGDDVLHELLAGAQSYLNTWSRARGRKAPPS